MEYFSVKNNTKFQHYKNRTPPWIKLHRTIFTDYEFSCLQDASKLHLILIWLLASEMDNKIPYDPEWVQKRLGLQNAVDLKVLKDNGFIVIDSTALAECLQDARPEGEGYKQEGYKQEGEIEESAPPRRRVEANRDPTEKPDVQSCIVHYQFEFHRKFKQDAFVKNLNATKSLLPVVTKFGVDETNRLLSLYLEITDDDLICQKGYPIYLFPDAVNRLQSGKVNGAKQTHQEKQNQIIKDVFDKGGKSGIF